MGIFNRWGLPNKDLSNIPYADGYKCPKCGADYPEDRYEVKGEAYPKCYNEVLFSTSDGFTHDWCEVHRCPECDTEYRFNNGCF